MAIRRNINSYDDQGNVQNFGELLRNTREQHGIGLSEVARELRVREDILVAIENSDFSKIPPQGYSRNMIKSYSRLLGLNANKVTNMFLDAEYSYQIGKKQASYQKINEENRRRTPMGYGERISNRTPREQLESRSFSNKSNLQNSTDGSTVKTGFGNRQMHNMPNQYKNTPRYRRERDAVDDVRRGRSSDQKDPLKRNLFAGDDYESAHKRLEKRLRNNSVNAAENGKSGFAGNGITSKITSGLKTRQVIGRKEANNFTDEENPNFVGNQPTNKSGYQFMNVYQSKNNSRQFKFTVPIIAGIVVILLVILILVLFFIGKQNEDNKADVSNINVTGLTDPEKANNDASKNANPGEAPKEVEFSYKVKDGQSCYLEIYENGQSKPTLSKQVKSGETQTYKVTDTLKVITTKPDAVEFKLNDQVVQPQDTNKTGVYSYTVDFKQYLADWKKQNGIVDDASSSNTTVQEDKSKSQSSSSSKSSSSSSKSKTKKKK